MERTAASQIIFLASFVILVHRGCSADCSVNVNSGDFPSPQPLLLRVGSDRDFAAFVTPDSSGNISVSAGTKLLLACPNATIALLDAESAEATCVSGSVFSVAGTPYTLNVLACSQLLKATIDTNSERCGVNATHKTVRVGFTVQKEFYKLYEVCFDTAELTPLYTSATISAGIKGYQQSKRPKWETGDLYGSLDVNNQYTTQRDTLVDQLGELPDNMSKNFLSRGHLAAKADFGLGVLQSATFFYANSAPQWYGFNGGNWNQLEMDVRAFASANGYDLEVYTGVYGKLKLPNATGNLTEVYLYASAEEKKLPVPMLFWKIVYEPRDKQAMVFVGVNNPYYSHSKLPAEYRLCTDVCSRVNWLHWKQTNQTGGLAYCCEYGDFVNKVTYAPTLVVSKTFSSSGADAKSALKLATVLSTVWLLLRLSYN
nr:double stranded RNA degrading enzyme 4 [Locusta migratoria]